jgi:hypothetical protein
MKSIGFVSGVLSCTLIALGIVFKIQHWPGANVLLVLGISIGSILFVYSIARYLYNRIK